LNVTFNLPLIAERKKEQQAKVQLEPVVATSTAPTKKEEVSAPPTPQSEEATKAKKEEEKVKKEAQALNKTLEQKLDSMIKVLSREYILLI
jgi:hypothetical protein